jgi:hypothetical protein
LLVSAEVARKMLDIGETKGVGNLPHRQFRLNQQPYNLIRPHTPDMFMN